MITTLDDALDVARSLRGRLEDLDQPELAAEAGKLVAYIVEQAHDIERQRALRAHAWRSERATGGDPTDVEGHALVEGADGGGRRDFLAGRPVPAGQGLYLLTCLGWHQVRYESNIPRPAAVIYLPLPGVFDEPALKVPRDARFAWPDELGRNFVTGGLL